MRHHEAVGAIRERMGSITAPDLSVRTFLFHYGRVIDGESGLLGGAEIGPVIEVTDTEQIDAYRKSGQAQIGRVAVIKLNGGLGTSMGLERAKSLLSVRGELTFLDLIARQVLALRQSSGAPGPLLLMNSFHTDQDSLRQLERYPELRCNDLPLSFLQHRVPKIDADTLRPVEWPANPELEWCPPGHGDLYPALVTSGLLDRLLGVGVEVAFVSNADNLGAVVDPALLGYVLDNGLGFVLEVADRSHADRKGGHLCRLADGRLALRESAQCPKQEVDQFQDIGLYRYFNTNSLWIHLPTLKSCLEASDHVLDLPTMVNRKPVDPRDPKSPRVLQLETAMGAAISAFPRAAAVRVPRSRFSPVKTTDDLLAVRSDAYALTRDGRIVLDGSRSRPPTIELDAAFFKMLDDFEARFPSGVPSLRECDSLAVEGDVRFGSNVKVRGATRVVGGLSASMVSDGTLLEGTVGLDDIG